MEFVNSSLNFISHIIILVAIIQYMKKYSSSAEGIMMLVGTITGMLTSIFFTVIFPYLVSRSSYDDYRAYVDPIGALGTLSYLIFAVGLLLAFQKVVAEKK